MKNNKKMIEIFKKVLKQNEKIYNIKSTAIILLFFSKISYLFSPFLILLKINPNKITYFNFLTSIILVTLIFFASNQNNFIIYGVLLYFSCLIIDFCDGTVARYFKITSFYGKFIDGLVDVFLKTFLILSLSVYGFEMSGDKLILILGSLSSLLASFDTFILDRYSATVRWFNKENKKDIKPYIRKVFLPRLTFLYSDIFIISIGFVLLTKDYPEIFNYNLLLIFFISSLSAIQNLIIHIFFSYKNLKYKNKG